MPQKIPVESRRKFEIVNGIHTVLGSCTLASKTQGHNFHVVKNDFPTEYYNGDIFKEQIRKDSIRFEKFEDPVPTQVKLARPRLVQQVLNNKINNDERKEYLQQLYDQETTLPIFTINRAHQERVKELLNKTNLDHLEPPIKKEIQDLIVEYNDIFYLSGDEMPTVSDVEHHIKLNTDKPVSVPLYRHPISLQPEIERQIEEYEKKG